MELLGIDIGGSGIKGAIVNAATGELVTERLRLPSPPTFQPDEVVAIAADLVKQFNYSGPIGVGFLEDQTGGYTIPFTVTAVVTYLAAVAVLFARPARQAGASEARPPDGGPTGRQ